MSIGLAFSCSDGLVVCADQEMSTGAFISYAPKITEIQLSPGRSMLLAQAGMVMDLDGTVEEVKRRVENKGLGIDEVRKHFKASLDAVIGKRSKSGHQTLVALPERIVWRSQETQIAQLPQGSHSVIGYGEQALAHYLLSVFVDTGSTATKLSSLQACLMGLYIIRQAKLFVPTCGAGGPTDVILLSPDGEVNQPFPEAVGVIEELLSTLDRLLGHILRMGLTEGVDDSEAVARFREGLFGLRLFSRGLL